MKKIFYILALGIGLAGCSNNEDVDTVLGAYSWLNFILIFCHNCI